MDTSGYGPGRLIQDLGDLLDGQPSVVVKDESRPLIHAQPTESPLELVAIGDLAEWVGRVFGRLVRHAGSLVSRSLRLGITSSNKKPVEPGAEPQWITQARQISPSLEQGLLGRVVSKREVAQDSEGEPTKPFAFEFDDAPESLLVAPLCPCHKVLIHRLRLA